MKIILLRHEERDKDPSFHVHLNKNGLIKRNTILSRLKENNIEIDLIFSSPFLRCLDTVLPVCDYYHKDINVDYSLSEFFDVDYLGDKKPRNFTKDELELYPINLNYLSSLPLDKFKDTYDWDSLQSRLKNFTVYLKEKYPNKIILIVAHLSVINAILNVNNVSRTIEDPLEMGKMTYIDNFKTF